MIEDGIYVADGRQAVRLDRGSPADITDLGADGDDLTWRHGGVERRAPLAPRLGGCALAKDLFGAIATPDVVVAYRNSGIGATSRLEAVACLRDGPDGFVAIGRDAVRVAGRLAAMVGERMKPEGHAEVSAVCVHPDFRGRGFAAGLTRVVGERIRARGETPFLHAYASNTPAITLYEQLGYSLRREVLATRLTAA
jgi:GNAT superfamily N-acetyltransferase